MDLTDEQIKRIVDHSFIDEFNPEKHEPRKYKIILLLGKCTINGINQDGETAWYHHVNYIIRALASSKYKFPESFTRIIKSAKDNIETKYPYWEFYYNRLASQGICILANWTDDNLDGEKKLDYGFFMSAYRSQKQDETLLKIKELLDKDNENKIEVSQLTVSLKRVNGRIIRNEKELTEFNEDINTGNIINVTKKRTKNGFYEFSYLLREGKFEDIDTDVFFESITSLEGSVK